MCMAPKRAPKRAPRRALISGAGIAGATLAFWLARTGWSVTVVERATGTRSSGNPVDVRGEASAITHAMGLDERLRAADTGVTHAAFIDAEGRPRAVIRTRRAPRPDGPAEVELARADLAAALLDTARQEAEVVFGDSVTALAQDPDGVDVTFEHARPARFDLVFGADGLHSTVRRLAFGPESEFTRPFGMAVATVRLDLAIADPARVLLYNEPGRLLAVHPAGGHPGAAFIFRTSDAPDPRDQEAAKRFVETAYADCGWRAPELLARWRAADDVYFDAVTRVELDRWTRGRIALLGDAASCLSLFGEGSSNAIVAGRTVAEALASHGDDHAAALAAYERTHRRRVRRFQRGAVLGSHFLVPATGLGIRTRDAAIRMMPRGRG